MILCYSDATAALRLLTNGIKLKSRSTFLGSLNIKSIYTQTLKSRIPPRPGPRFDPENSRDFPIGLAGIGRT